jgi:hypothetical protein
MIGSLKVEMLKGREFTLSVHVCGGFSLLILFQILDSVFIYLFILLLYLIGLVDGEVSDLT